PSTWERSRHGPPTRRPRARDASMSRTIARVRSRLQDQHGFTLAELLVAMMILVIVIVIFDGALVSIQQGVASEDLRSQNNDQARLAIESLDREIRSANYIYD